MGSPPKQELSVTCHPQVVEPCLKVTSEPDNELPSSDGQAGNYLVGKELNYLQLP